MNNYAVDALKDAFSKTRIFFLSPFSLKKWLKLGLVGMFGGVVQQGSYNCNSSSNSSSSGGSSSPSGSGDVAKDIKETVDNLVNCWQDDKIIISLLAGFAIILITAIVLVFSYIKSAMFFIFIESLVKKEVAILRSFDNNRGKAFSLFLFRVITGFVSFILLIILSIPLMLALWNMIQAEELNLLGLISSSILTVVSIFVIGIVSHCISSPTNDFAAAITYVKDNGILGGWSVLIRLIAGNPLEFLLYYVLKVALAAGIGFILIIPVLILFLFMLIVYMLLLIPAVLVIVITIMLYTANPVLGIIATIVSALIGIAIFVIMMLVSFLFFCLFLPIHVFFRFYALSFLEKFQIGLDFSEEYNYTSSDTGVKADSFSENTSVKDERKEAPEGNTWGNYCDSNARTIFPDSETDKDDW